MVLEHHANLKKLSVSDYLHNELSKQPTISEEEIIAFFKENRNQFPSHIDSSIFYKKIEQYLNQKDKDAHIKALLKDLYKRYSVQVSLPNPNKPISIPKNPYITLTKGPKKAPIHIVVFSDLQCRFCKVLHEKIETLQTTYPNKFLIEFRHLPLPMHVLAKPAAKASLCAAKQGKFWPYIDAIYDKQTRLSKKTLAMLPKTLGLSEKKIDACLNEDWVNKAIQYDNKTATELGIMYTPTLFINGHFFTKLPHTDIIFSLSK